MVDFYLHTYWSHHINSICSNLRSTRENYSREFAPVDPSIKLSNCPFWTPTHPNKDKTKFAIPHLGSYPKDQASHSLESNHTIPMSHAEHVLASDWSEASTSGRPNLRHLPDHFSHYMHGSQFTPSSKLHISSHHEEDKSDGTFSLMERDSTAVMELTQSLWAAHLWTVSLWEKRGGQAHLRRAHLRLPLLLLIGGVADDCALFACYWRRFPRSLQCLTI